MNINKILKTHAIFGTTTRFPNETRCIGDENRVLRIFLPLTKKEANILSVYFYKMMKHNKSRFMTLIPYYRNTSNILDTDSDKYYTTTEKTTYTMIKIIIGYLKYGLDI